VCWSCISFSLEALVGRCSAYLVGKLGKGFPPLLSRRWMNGDGRRCYGYFDFLQSTLLWQQRTHSLGCQHELQPGRNNCLYFYAVSTC
jgi:hypothetical protein